MAQAMLAERPAQAAEYRRITVKKLCGAAGAEIGGVDLSKPLESETAAEIHRAFLENSVVAFRDQDLSPERQIAFTEIFGKVEQHPLYRSNPIEGFPEILVLEHKAGQYINGKNDIWHADITFKEEPPLGSMLHCRAAWEGFADTMFANQYMAYEALSEPLQRLFVDMKAEHDASILPRENNKHDYNTKIGDIPPPVVHPVVRTHPETGRKALFVNAAYTIRLLGVSEDESKKLLDLLYAHAVRPDFVYRHRWRVGDVVIFDNRCLLHYVVPDHPHDMHRRMHRTTAAGDRPF
ncbi:MAG: TauD/TfdA family dioxygenase [Alphaproteobacteria bacterium]|nr:TauD/TfdA family dioxygenase [Alphaproteobacteria bacterium]